MPIANMKSPFLLLIFYSKGVKVAIQKSVNLARQPGQSLVLSIVQLACDKD